MQRESIASISFQNLKVAFGEKRAIFDGVNFDFPMGKIVWIKGDSGSGKSVLLKVLNGAVEPTAGHYCLNGRSVHEMTFEEFVPLRLNLGYSFDFGGLINNRTIYGNLSLPIEYHKALSPIEAHRRVTEYMHLFNLQEVANERPSALAGGMRKATCVARAFMLQPEVLLLDDPTTGLRGELSKRLKAHLLKIKTEGQIKSIFIATEDFGFVDGLCDSVIELKDQTMTTSLIRGAA